MNCAYLGAKVPGSLPSPASAQLRDSEQHATVLSLLPSKSLSMPCPPACPAHLPSLPFFRLPRSGYCTRF